nr:hypothetical protein [uncultured Duganella sp.]
MDEKQQPSSTEKSIAQAYAAYMIALAARNNISGKPEGSQQRAFWKSTVEQKKSGSV